MAGIMKSISEFAHGDQENKSEQKICKLSVSKTATKTLQKLFVMASMT